jgi:hypothetical protein
MRGDQSGTDEMEWVGRQSEFGTAQRDCGLRLFCDGAGGLRLCRGCDEGFCYGKRVTTMEEDERAAVNVSVVMRRGGGPAEVVRDEPAGSRSGSWRL